MRRHKRSATTRVRNGEQHAVSGTVVNPDGPDETLGNGGATYAQAASSAAAGVSQLVEDPRTLSERNREAARLRAVGGDKRWQVMSATHEWAAGARYTITGEPSRERLAATFRELEGLDQHIGSMRKVAASIGLEQAEALQGEIETLARMYTAMAPTGIRASGPARQKMLDDLTDEQIVIAHRLTEQTIGQIEAITNQTSEQLTTDDDKVIKTKKKRFGGVFDGVRGGSSRGGGMGMGGRGQNNRNQGKGEAMKMFEEIFKKLVGLGGR
jgi:hypothetical protein